MAAQPQDGFGAAPGGVTDPTITGPKIQAYAWVVFALTFGLLVEVSVTLPAAAPG